MMTALGILSMRTGAMPLRVLMGFSYLGSSGSVNSPKEAENSSLSDSLAIAGTVP